MSVEKSFRDIEYTSRTCGFISLKLTTSHHVSNRQRYAYIYYSKAHIDDWCKIQSHNRFCLSRNLATTGPLIRGTKVETCAKKLSSRNSSFSTHKTPVTAFSQRSILLKLCGERRFNNRNLKMHITMPRCRCLLHYSSFIMSAMDNNWKNARNMQALKMLWRSAGVKRLLCCENHNIAIVLFFASCVSLTIQNGFKG